MTTIKTITQEHLESTLLKISNSYEEEMTKVMSNYREGNLSFSAAVDKLTNTFVRYSGQLTGIIRLMGVSCASYDMIDSLRSSFYHFFRTLLFDFSPVTEGKSQATEIQEKDEIVFLHTDSVTQQIVREVESEVLPANQPVSVKNPSKGHCAYCAAYLFSIPNNPGLGGRSSRYCSNACKMKAYRQRYKTVFRKPPHSSQRVTKVLAFAQPTGATQQVTL